MEMIIGLLKFHVATESERIQEPVLETVTRSTALERLLWAEIGSLSLVGHHCQI